MVKIILFIYSIGFYILHVDMKLL